MKNNKFVTILFILYPLIDLLTALQVRYFSFPVSIGVVVRGLIILMLKMRKEMHLNPIMLNKIVIIMIH